MSNSGICRVEMLEMAEHLPSISNKLRDVLEAFTRQYYCIKNLAELNETILGLEKSGDLVVFYDRNDKVIGFTRICRQIITLKGKAITVYSGSNYHAPHVNTNLSCARFGLTKAMRYKLAHPNEEMVYFANANTPARYQFLATLSNTIYPKEGIRIPETILSLVVQLKQQNHWQSHPSHPMIISDQLMPLPYPSASTESNDSLARYYRTLNPDYRTGNALLVYLPLNLINISQGIKRVITSPTTHMLDSPSLSQVL